MLGASRDRTTAVGEPTEFRSLTDRKSSPPDFSAGIIRDWFRPLLLPRNLPHSAWQNSESQAIAPHRVLDLVVHIWYMEADLGDSTKTTKAREHMFPGLLVGGGGRI